MIYAAENLPDWAPRASAALSRHPGETFAVAPIVKAPCLVKRFTTADLAPRLAGAHHPIRDALWANDERLAQAGRGLAKAVTKAAVPAVSLPRQS